MILFSKYLDFIGWKTKTIGIPDIRGESSFTFVEDGDISYSTYRPTWMFVFFSRTILLQ